MTVSIQEAAQKRAEAAGRAGIDERQARSTPPGDVQVMRRSAPTCADMRAERATKNGKSFLKLTGYATTYERGYQMFDWAGEYTEIVSAGSGAETLSRNPNCVYQVNHGGWPFARTTAGSLDLSEDTTGLLNTAWLNPERADAVTLYQAVQDGALNEMSFMFSITSGQWSPDYTEYRINAYDLERGDVSPVTYGANPTTSIEARAAHFELRAEVMRFLRSTDGQDLATREVLVEQVAATIGAKAAEDLRHLRACVEQDSMGALEKATLAAVLQRAVDGSLTEALAGESSLAVLLDVRAPVAEPTPEAPPFRAVSVEFVAAELDVARQLTY